MINSINMERMLVSLQSLLIDFDCPLKKKNEIEIYIFSIMVNYISSITLPLKIIQNVA